MDLGIAGKWALVCGASKGLGRGCAEALAGEGVHLVVAARTREVLEETARALRQQAATAARPVQVLAAAADVTTAAGRDSVFALARAQGIDFDIVVTNAAGPPPGDFRQWTREDWIAAVDANMLAPIELFRRCVDGMAQRGFGRIVNITSTAVKAPIDVLGLSNGARSGLTGFVAGIARSAVARQGVTINNLLPGNFETARLLATIDASGKAKGQSLEQERSAWLGRIPAGRFGSAQEFGAVCAFLCSQHAGYVNGQNILLDGGAYPGVF